MDKKIDLSKLEWAKNKIIEIFSKEETSHVLRRQADLILSEYVKYLDKDTEIHPETKKLRKESAQVFKEYVWKLIEVERKCCE